MPDYTSSYDYATNNPMGPGPTHVHQWQEIRGAENAPELRVYCIFCLLFAQWIRDGVIHVEAYGFPNAPEA